MHFEIFHEMKSECREFVLLQGEHVEGLKRVITMQSIDWAGQAKREDSICAKVSYGHHRK